MFSDAMTPRGQADGRFDSAAKMALVAIAVFVSGQVLDQSHAADEIDEGWIGETASDLNRLLPRQVDSETRLDRITAGPGRHLNFHYTLLDRTRAGMDIEAFNAGIQSLLRGAICRKEGLPPPLKNSMTLTYHYRGSDGKFVSMIEISPQSCR